jgi:phage nucleotide-binding protein
MTEIKRTDSKIRAVIYGEAGAGKTHLLREFPKPMLIFDFDQKYEPLIGAEGIDIVSYTIDTTNPKSALEMKKKFWQDWKDMLKSDYETIVIDSLTNLDSILLQAFMIEAGKAADDKPTLPIYMDIKTFYQTLFNSARELTQRKNFIVLAHEKFHTNDEGGIIGVKPLITGSMKDELSALFRDTWYLEYKKLGQTETRTLYYAKWNFRTCASTTLRGDGKIVSPTYEKIKKEMEKK